VKHLWLVTLMLIGCGSRVIPTTVESSSGRLVFKASRTGHVLFVEPSINGATMTVSQGGFLSRTIETRDRGDEYLWEDDPELPFHYTNALVYNNYLHALVRPVGQQMKVVPTSAIVEHPRAYTALLEALEVLNRTDRDLHWIISDPSSSDQPNTVLVHVDPEEPWFDQLPDAGALAFADLEGPIITGGRVILRSLDIWPGNHFPRVFAHELAHIRGLGHPPDDMAEGIMGAPHPVLAFSQREQEVMRNMFRRTPGTRPPDDSLAVTRAFSRQPMTHLVCRQPL